MLKQGRKQEREPRHDQELEELKRVMRARAAAIAGREQELDRRERKLAQRERRLGRRLRVHRSERSLFAPVQRKVADRTDEGAKLERKAAALEEREERLSAREAETESLVADLSATRKELERTEAGSRSAPPTWKPVKRKRRDRSRSRAAK